LRIADCGFGEAWSIGHRDSAGRRQPFDSAQGLQPAEDGGQRSEVRGRRAEDSGQNCGLRISKLSFYDLNEFAEGERLNDSNDLNVFNDGPRAVAVVAMASQADNEHYLTNGLNCFSLPMVD
jgi:hypothetical protein